MSTQTTHCQDYAMTKYDKYLLSILKHQYSKACEISHDDWEAFIKDCEEKGKDPMDVLTNNIVRLSKVLTDKLLHEENPHEEMSVSSNTLPIPENDNESLLSIYPLGIDKECEGLYDVLNALNGLKTTSSCCGHCKERYMMFFDCDDFSTLGLLGRVTDRNYSDGKWEVLVVNSDNRPKYSFGLFSKEPFSTPEEMKISVNQLIDNIKHWSSIEFDKYFERS